jgi:hypothetical protein
MLRLDLLEGPGEALDRVAYHVRARRVPAAALVVVLAAMLTRGVAVLAGPGSPLLPPTPLLTRLGSARYAPIVAWTVQPAHSAAAIATAAVLAATGTAVYVGWGARIRSRETS